MSIQSQINRINGAVNTQADKIAQIKAALEGKAAGGGGGSELQIATGTFTPTSTDCYTNPISVTGLPFAPKVLFIMVYNTNISTGKATKSRQTFYGYESVTRRSIVFYYSNTNASAVSVQQNYDSYVVTLKSDGFSIKGESVYRLVFTLPYFYIAIG